MEQEFFSCQMSRRLVGDPVDVVTGANTDFKVDFRLDGPLPLSWRRYYNSANNTMSLPLGWGQMPDFGQTLTYDLEGLRYTDPLGSVVAFPLLEIGECDANSGLLLRRVSKDTYEVVSPDQPVQIFEFNVSSDTAPLRRLRQGVGQINFHYGSNGRLCEIIDSLGRLITVEWERNARIIGVFLHDASAQGNRRALMIYEYDAAGNLILGRDMYNATLRFRWDQYNRMICQTNRCGYSFHFEYDEKGRCIHSRGDDGLFEVFLDYQPDLKTTSVRRGDGGQWTYLYNAAGTVMQITDPYGGATCFLLDEIGRIAEEIDPIGSVTKHHYNAQGEHDYLIDPNGYALPTAGADSDASDPLGYNLPDTPLEWEFGNLVTRDTIKLPKYNDSTFSLFPVPVRNAVLGLADAEQAAAFPQSNNTPELERTDDHGRPLEHIGSNFTERWRYDANGNLIEHQDRDNRVSCRVFLSWNALCEQIDPLGQTTKFEHTVQGLVAKVTDPGGTVTEYEYNQKEQLVAVKQHTGNRETYLLDPAGNITEKRGTNGHTLAKWKIGLGNLEKARILSSGEEHRFEHDGRGRITKAATQTSVATFSYDDSGRLLTDQRDGKGIAHEFDSEQLVRTTYFEKFTVIYARAANGDLIIKDPIGAKHHFKFSESGLIAKLFANGIKELCRFDSKGRCLLKAVVRSRSYALPWMRSYVYSAADDLVECQDTERGSRKYSYDAAHRLIEDLLPNGALRRFTWDAAGNLHAQPGLTHVVMGTGNRLVAANGDCLVYNDRDHVSVRNGLRGTIRYEYNDLDMLVRCDINGEPWTASYDAYCRRIQKSWRGRTTTYYWDDFRLAAELRHDGSVRIYIYADDIALVPFLFVEYEGLDAESTSGKLYYTFTDQVGVPIRIEDDAGHPCWSAWIDPYGLAHEDPGSTTEMPLRFPGHYYDSETGLHYNRFRYFSPELGRYLQSDPAGQEGGINVYAYPVNPLIGVDIDGLRGRGRAQGKKAGRNTKNGPNWANASCPLGSPPGPRKLVDQMIKDGHIVIQGDPKYQKKVKSDLYRVASTKTGRNTLNTIRNSGHTVTIKNGAVNGCAGGKAPGARPKGSVPKDPSDGIGTGTGGPSTVQHNPHDTSRPPESPPDAALNHELGHAAHNSTGTNQRDSNPPSPAVVKSSPNLEEHNTTMNEDNAYRQERGLPERDDYEKLPGEP